MFIPGGGSGGSGGAAGHIILLEGGGWVAGEITGSCVAMGNGLLGLLECFGG